MGYTHYLTIYDEGAAARVLPDVARDLRSLLGRRVFDFPLAGPDGRGEPEITDEFIAFNGAAPEQDYETCLLDPADPNPFVKTGPDFASRRPYDLAVMTALALWRWHAGEALAVDSDGYLAQWAPATDLVVRELGYPVDPYFVLERAFGVWRVGGLRLWVEEPASPNKEALAGIRERLLQLPEEIRDPAYAPAGSLAHALAPVVPERLEERAVRRVGEAPGLPPGAVLLAPELGDLYLVR